VRSQECLSDLDLDRLLGGEIEAGAGAAAARAHASACPDCTRRIAELRTDAAPFANDLWVRGLAVATARAARRWPRITLPAIAGGALAAAAVLLVVVRPQSDDGTRTKGTDSLSLIVQSPDGTTGRVVDGGHLSPGDSVRFEVSTDTNGFLTILGLDAAPRVTRYVPSMPGEARPIALGRRQRLRDTIVLDATLGAERIVALVCPREVATGDLVEAAQRALAGAGGDPRRVGDLDVHCAQSSVLVEKAPRGGSR
jgi:hypothetical protein